MAEQTQERTERATHRRRQEVRRQGTVARSADLSSSLPLVLLAVMLPSIGTIVVNGVFQALRNGLDISGAKASGPDIAHHFFKTAVPVVAGCVLIAGIAMLVGLFANFAQVGIHPTLEPIAPKLERLNPLNGIKRLLSRRGLFETAKSVAKLGIVGWIAFHETQANWDEMLNLGLMPAAAGMAWLGRFVALLILKVSFAWLVLGAVDYWWQRRMYEKDIMMSIEEVKREMRETETSPELRAEMHRRRQRLARACMMANVKHADAVITNPTEYAVAIKYDPKRFAAPVVLAKGRHLTAERIREEAKKQKVPIVPNPPLARSLFEQVEVGDQIPSALFQAVAEVLAFVFKKSGKKL